MIKRVAVCLLLLSLVSDAAMPTQSCFAAGKPIAPGGPDLKTTLEKGLKLRRPVEFDFVAHVMQLVDDGTLPESLVKSTFLWARRKRPYPYPFFERGLKQRAKKLGVTI